MNWLLIAIIAHFLFALVFIVDKFLLSKTVLKPIVYAFYTGILQLFVLFLIPFGFELIPFKQLIISFSAGALFTLAVLALYKSFQLGEVSKITPIIGGAIPIFTIALTYLFLGERLTFLELIAFCLLVLGSVIMFLPKRGKPGSSPKIPLIQRLSIAFLAALFFAGSFVLTKYIFYYQPFINGFIWTRLGGFLMGSLIFLWPSYRQSICQATKGIHFKTLTLFFSDKIVAALAFVLLNYAIFLGSVSLVNALQGVQYFFLLIIALLLSKKYPQVLEEQISNGIIMKKIIAILFISLGIGLLAF